MSFNSPIANFKFKSLDFQKEIKVKVHLLYYNDFDPLSLLDYLNDSERQKVRNFNSLKRQREFVAVRVLKKKLFAQKEICYSAIGAPYIKKENYISISHANNVVGIGVSESPIGLDLEPINEKVHRVKDKFLAENEKLDFNINSTIDLITIWSAKEALYKLSGEKGLIFSKNLILSAPKEGFIPAKIQTTKQNKNIYLQVVKEDDFVVSINVSALRDEK